MAFTFTLPPASDRDELRIILTDVEEDGGPLPNSGNLSDEMLDYWLEEGGGVRGAAALAFDYLSVAWINNPVFGPGELSTIHVSLSEKYAKKAAEYRNALPQDVGGAAVVRIGQFTRVDGYSRSGGEYSS